jgi:hypothetical protein
MKCLDKLLLILALLLACKTGVFGQDTPHSSVTVKSLFIADAIATSADFAFTHRASTEPVWHENDPIARPFVTHGTPLQAAFFATKFLVFEGAAWQLRKHNHRRLAVAVQILSVGLSTDGAIQSAKGYNTIR